MLKTTTAIFLYIILLLPNDVPSFTLPVIMSMIYGFGIRICLDWGANVLTLKKTVQQLVYAAGLCWIIQIVWKEAGLKWNVVYVTWVISIFSMIIISEISAIFKLSFRAYLRNLINNFIAKDKEDDKT